MIGLIKIGTYIYKTPSELKTRLPGNGFALEITPEIFDPQMISLLESIKDITISRSMNIPNGFQGTSYKRSYQFATLYYRNWFH